MHLAANRVAHRPEAGILGCARRGARRRPGERRSPRVATLRKEYRIGRVYLLGFSAGAHLGYIFSVKQRASIAGFIPMAGALRLQAIAGNELDRVKGLPVFAIQGANDQVVSPAAAKHSVAIFRDHGAVTTLHEHAGGHVAPPDCAKVLRQAIAWIEANLETAAVVR